MNGSMSRENNKTIPKNMNLIPAMEETRFTFWNGDHYEGEFTGVKDKQQIVMEGNGIYTTADQQIYVGKWENDSLIEANKIIFSDESEFSGNLSEMMIQGRGKYRFKDNVEIEGDFAGNYLMENLNLRDPGGHLWRGNFEPEHTYVSFRPCHSFWQFVFDLPKKGNFFFEEYQEEQDFWENNFI